MKKIPKTEPLPALPDQAARRDAVTDFQNNLVVTAGAGTGKTSLLVERLINWVVGLDVPLGRLAVITFTKKAAAELRERLTQSLELLLAISSGDLASESAADGMARVARGSYAWLRGDRGLSDQEIRGRCSAAIDDLDSALVNTIHGFCTDLLRLHAREAGLSPDFRVDEGAAMENLFEEFWPRVLLEELQAHGPRAALWSRILPVLALDKLKELARPLCDFTAPLPPADAVNLPHLSDPAAVLGARAAQLARRIRELAASAGVQPEPYPLAAARPVLELVERGERGTLAAALEILKLEKLKKLEGQAGETGVDVAEFLKDAARVDEELVDHAVRAIVPLAHRFQQEYAARQWISFNGLLVRFRDLLAGSEAVREGLKQRLQGLMVDEFQDTDPLQYEIVLWLAEEPGRHAEDAYEAQLAPGKLFIVGDPKQSIYRFRGADIAAYQRAVDCMRRADCRSLTLSANFRSSPGIIEAVNGLFGRWMGPRGEYEADYERIEHPGGGGTAAVPPAVEVWTVPESKTAEARRREEGDAVARWIVDQAGPEKNWGFKDVAILLRALKDVDLYVAPLRRAGIPVVVSGGKNLVERSEFSECLSLLRALANPNDAVAVLTLLRSPLGAVPDTELMNYASFLGARNAAGWNYESARVDESFAALHRTFRWLRRLRQELLRRPVGEVLRLCLEEVPLLELNAAATDGAQRAANVEMFLRRAIHLVEDQGVGLERVNQLLDAEMKQEERRQESPLADETVDAVRVMSIHRAKGLEFPVVFVPDLARYPRLSGPEKVVLAEHRSASDPPRWAVSFFQGPCNSAAVLWDAERRNHERAEEKRLFYVASTRAARLLILLNGDWKQQQPWARALQHWGYRPESTGDGQLLCAGAVMHRLLPAGEEPPARSQGTRAVDHRAPVLAYKQTLQALAQAGLPAVRHPSDAEPSRGQMAFDYRSPVERKAARRLGTVVHEALRDWDFADSDDLVSRIPPLLRRFELDPEADLRYLDKEARAILLGFADSEACRRIAGAELLGRELPMLFRDVAGQTWQGVLDLLLREDGRLVIVDYKTDQVGDKIGSAAESYRGQLTLYAEAVRRAFALDKPPGCRLVFLRAAASVDL